MPPPGARRLIVSRTGSAGTAAPYRAAASSTASTTRRGTSGRAASCTRTREAPPTAASPRRTESCRSGPPATSTTRAAASPRARRAASRSDTTATTSPMRGWAENAATARARIGTPPRGRNALGVGEPMRVPRPAATMRAATVMLTGAPPGARPRGGAGRGLGSDLQELFFLVLGQLVDLLDVLVGGLLDLVEGPLLLVLGDRLVLEQLLETLVGVAPLQADRGAPVLGDLVHPLGQLLATFLRVGRDRDAHDLAVVGRVETELRGAHRLLDLRDQGRVPRLRHDQRRVRDGQAGHLRQRRLRAVVLDGDAVEDGQRGAPGPQRRQLPA